MSRAMRYTVGVLTALAAMLVVAAPAGAHAPAQQQPDAPYYRTEITGGVTPAVAGVTASVDPGGEWIELSNAGPATVVVLGYGGEPYLRLTPTSAEENELSQTTYVNQTLFSASVPTAQAQPDSSVAPAWKRIGATGKVRWHDHRIHWMGATRPPAVAADPTHPHLVGNWTVHAIADGTPFEINGSLKWIGKTATATGKSSPVQAWLLTLLVGAVVVVGMLIIALVRTRRRLAHGAGAPAAGAGSDAAEMATAGRSSGTGLG
ncbi:hypothetical protein HC031_29455 [Planosporangium thailandense]|uniref:Uncharacterized protein n=1 Tax=Planosporangium thailandense TaxID=765197 RepID=A0ABX0Y8E9_9ACTN|nr:hypothetical protein [Planosporangium thailandense]NJC73810.1 hypothetical protein [Planosporangium thailandense]